MRLFASFLGIATAFFLFPGLSFAQVSQLQGIVNLVISNSPLPGNIPTPGFTCPTTIGAGVGACYLASLFVYAVQQGRLLIGTLALITIVTAAFNLIVRQSEETLATARRTVVGVVVGLFLIFTAEKFVDALYGGFTVDAGTMLTNPANVQTGATIFSEELLGIVRWGETLVAIVAIGLLVLEGVRVLASFGSEQIIQKAYRATYSTVLGILLIVFDRTIAAIFGYTQIAAFPGAPDASIFIVEVFSLVRLVLSFLGIIAVAIIVYAGLLMIFNFGNDELLTKARTMLFRAAIGFLLIGVAFLIVHFVIIGATAVSGP